MLLIVGLLFWLGDNSLTHMYGLSSPIAAALACAQAAPLLLAVTRPLPAWWILTAANVIATPFLLHALDVHSGSAQGPPGWPWPLEVVLGQYVVLIILVTRERTATLVAVWLVLAGLSYGLAWSYQRYNDSSDTLLMGFGSLFMVVGWSQRNRRWAERRLFDQQLEGQAERARIALLEERARIARELHDVVAHHMSVIAVQADSAPYRIEGLPGGAHAEFGSIAGTAREALTEMRRLLGVLRSEDDDGGVTPQPGVDRIPELVEAAAQAGIPTWLRIDGAVDGVRGLAGVELAVFRIVQESLANVVRHAPGTRARVEIAVDPVQLTILVVNGPPGSADVEAAATRSKALETGGTGHGLIGMRERIRLVGGALEAGATPDGGFRVSARIPLPAEDAEA
ncbi:MAG TPA: sensor histidine kinase [Actinocrinis sp.]